MCFVKSLNLQKGTRCRHTTAGNLHNNLSRIFILLSPVCPKMSDPACWDSDDWDMFLPEAFALYLGETFADGDVHDMRRRA